MIIFELSNKYNLKPFKILTCVDDIKKKIKRAESFEIIAYNHIRILFTINNNELIIHSPPSIIDPIHDQIENDFRRLHSELLRNLDDVTLTFDIVAWKEDIDIPNYNSYKYTILDLLNYNGIDYCNLSLWQRRWLWKEMFKYLLAGQTIPNHKASYLFHIFDTYQDIKDHGGEGCFVRHQLFGSEREFYSIPEFDYLLFRNNNSKYNSSEDGDWTILDMKSVTEKIYEQALDELSEERRALEEEFE